MIKKVYHSLKLSWKWFLDKEWQHSKLWVILILILKEIDNILQQIQQTLGNKYIHRQRLEKNRHNMISGQIWIRWQSTGKYIIKEKQIIMQSLWFINHQTIAKWIINISQNQLGKGIIKKWPHTIKIWVLKNIITNKFYLKLKRKDSILKEAKTS